MRLLLVVFILALALPLSAKIPIIKFYLNDGKTSQYKIEDISEINFIKSNLSYSMEIFIDGSINTHNIKDIKSIEFIDSTHLKINLSSSSENISIADIDSIIFVPNICTVVIGTQTWMAKNLDVNHYRNGDPIPEVKDSVQWGNLATGAWCYYNNDPANGAIYGKLYNWYAVNDPRGLAPKGWHVASDDEWTMMTNYIGGDSVASGKLKSIGTIESGTGLWHNPNEGATDEFGFSGLPGGGRTPDDPFHNMGYSGYWWSSTMSYTTGAWSRYLFFNATVIYRRNDSKSSAFSIRCIKD